jgi:hypothetical protein
MIMEGVQRVQNIASWIGKGTNDENEAERLREV